MSAQTLRERVEGYQEELVQRFLAIEVDAHWFRRIFHTFASSFLAVYLLPATPEFTVIKAAVMVAALILAVLLEFRRVRGRLDHTYFFGLRPYEKARPASYLYFGTGLVVLFLAFPQQIALPCILCVCFMDPAIGELRYRFTQSTAYLVAFLISLFFFVLTWSQASPAVLLPVAFLGAAAAVLGERLKLRWLDDDLLIQLLPALLIAGLWQGLLLAGIDILPASIIQPIGGSV